MIELRVVDTGEHPKGTNFEGQFASRTERRTPFEVISIIKIVPEHPIDKVPVLVLPGWSESDKVLKRTLEEIYKSGRIAVFPSYSRWRGQSLEGTFPKGQTRKAKTVLDVVEALEEQVDVITHSEGGTVAMIAAYQNPEKFRSIALVSGSGLIGKDSLLGLGLRHTEMTRRNKQREKDEPETKTHLKTYYSEGAKYFAKNPIRALKEIKGITETQIQGGLKQLRSKGVKIALIHGVDDPLYPMERVQANTLADQVDGFYSVKGDHNELHLQPEKYTKLALQALDDLNKLK